MLSTSVDFDAPVGGTCTVFRVKGMVCAMGLCGRRWMGFGFVFPWVSGWVCIEEGGSGRGDVRRPQSRRCSGYVLQSREADPRGRLPAYSRDLEGGYLDVEMGNGD